MEREYQPLVSVIIPTHNRPQETAVAIESVRRQTLADWEIIVVDDASTDGTADFLRERYADGMQIRVNRLEKSGGVGTARNVGMEMARGRYVMFLDSDDTLQPQGLEVMVSLAEQMQADVTWSMGRFYQRGNDCQLLPERDAPWISGTGLLPSEFGKRLSLLYRDGAFTGAVWNRIYRRAFLTAHAIRFAPLSNSEDILFNFICLYYAKNYGVTDSLYYIYHISGDSILRAPKTLEDIAKQVKTAFYFARLLWQATEKMAYFKDHPADRERVLENLMQGTIDLPCHWGAYPTPEQYRMTVADTLREALADQFGDDAWLIAALYQKVESARGRELKQMKK